MNEFYILTKSVNEVYRQSVLTLKLPDFFINKQFQSFSFGTFTKESHQGSLIFSNSSELITKISQVSQKILNSTKFIKKIYFKTFWKFQKWMAKQIFLIQSHNVRSCICSPSLHSWLLFNALLNIIFHELPLGLLFLRMFKFKICGEKRVRIRRYSKMKCGF